MSVPIISIIMPIYNVEKYIRNSLRSVMGQSFNNLEIICINDGSTDSSWELVKEQSLLDGRIRMIDLEGNHGQAFARNRGLEIAQGKYIMFVDADDTIQENAAQELYNQAEKTDADIVVYGFISEYETKAIKDKYYIREDDLSIYEGKIFTGSGFIKNCGMNDWPILVCWNMFFNKNFLFDNNLKFHEGIIHEDVLFVNMCVFKAGILCFLNKKLYVYNRRESSTTTVDVSLFTVKSFFIVFAEMFNFFLNNNYPQEEYKYFGKHIASYAVRPFRSYQNSKKEIPYNMIRFKDDLYNKLFAVFSEIQIASVNCRISKEELTVIKASEHLIVYGAGQIAKEAICYLLLNNINKFLIAVTKANKNEFLAGNRVRCIYDIKGIETRKTVVLLAVAKKNQGDISKTLNILGYKKIISFI